MVSCLKFLLNLGGTGQQTVHKFSVKQTSVSTGVFYDSPGDGFIQKTRENFFQFEVYQVARDVFIVLLLK